MSIWLKILIGGGLGLLVGGVLGHFGKCGSGRCPLTANPYRGSFIGAIVGVLIVLVWAELRPAGQAVGDVPHLTTVEQFDEKVLKSPMPVLVDFYATWCGACHKLAPIISKLKADYEGKVVVFKVNVDEAKELSENYKINAIPAVLLFDKGKVAKRWEGLMAESEYRRALDSIVVKQERSTQ